MKRESKLLVPFELIMQTDMSQDVMTNDRKRQGDVDERWRQTSHAYVHKEGIGQGTVGDMCGWLAGCSLVWHDCPVLS